MTNPNWDEFHPRQAPERAERHDPDFDELAAAVFNGGSGGELLKKLRARKVERRAGPGASEAVLRWNEAQRDFIFELESARDRGLEIMKAKAKAKV